MLCIGYLSGTFRTCQLCGFWHFSVVSATFASTCKHVVTWGGVCVYFLKSARKRHFRNVWVWGGGVVIFQRSTTHGTNFTFMGELRVALLAACFLGLFIGLKGLLMAAAALVLATDSTTNLDILK